MTSEIVSENTDPRQAVTIIDAMTRDEAESHVKAINNAAADMGRHLLDLKERHGWRALGYPTWTACLENEFRYSRKHLYELMNAAPVYERLSPTGNTLSLAAANALAAYDADLQPAILRTAQARYGALTESNVTRVGNVVETMARTGHVDTGSGESTPVEAALTIEDSEALKRQQDYIAGNSKRTLVLKAEAIVVSAPASRHFKPVLRFELTGEVDWNALDKIGPGQVVRLVLTEEVKVTTNE